MNMKLLSALFCAGTLTAASACAAAPSTITYAATLHPMNTKITGTAASGEARFSETGDQLTIDITMKGVSPDTVHWQHFHGFTDNRNATCPTTAADKNNDGIIDLIETEPTSGTTMVPFDANPVGMDVAHGKYPMASASGAYTYHVTVSLSALKAAFAKAFHGQSLDLDRRVVFIHGVPADTKLPASVASLDHIPAQVTLPIACGKIERVTQ